MYAWGEVNEKPHSNKSLALLLVIFTKKHPSPVSTSLLWLLHILQHVSINTQSINFDNFEQHFLEPPIFTNVRTQFAAIHRLYRRINFDTISSTIIIHISKTPNSVRS